MQILNRFGCICSMKFMLYKLPKNTAWRRSTNSTYLHVSSEDLGARSRALIQYKKMSSCQYRKSNCGGKTILRPSYLHNGISYTGKTAFLYWIRAQVSRAWTSDYTLQILWDVYTRPGPWYRFPTQILMSVPLYPCKHIATEPGRYWTDAASSVSILSCVWFTRRRKRQRRRNILYISRNLEISISRKYRRPSDRRSIVIYSTRNCGIDV